MALWTVKPDIPGGTPVTPGGAVNPADPPHLVIFFITMSFFFLVSAWECYGSQSGVLH